VAGGSLDFSRGAQVILQASNATPGTLNLSDDIRVNAGGGGILTQGVGSRSGRVDLGNALRTVTVTGDDSFLVTASVVSGGLRKLGSGTLVLSGNNDYSGGTRVEAGRLLVAGSGALGRGNVELRSGQLGMTGGLFRVRIGGGYTQRSGSTLTLRIGGAAIADGLQMGGRAELGGRLVLEGSQGLRLRRGDRVELIRAEGGVSGGFEEVEKRGLNTGTLLETRLVTGPEAVALVAKMGSFEEFAKRTGLSWNQRSTGRALDRAEADPRENKLMQSLSEVPLGQLPAAFERIAPEELASLYHLATASVRFQNNNIEQRLQEVRVAGHGFSTAGLRTMDVRQGVPQEPGSGVQERTLSKENKEWVKGERSPWSFFVSGNLQLMDVGSTPGARGFDLETSGVTVGADRLLNENLLIGVTSGYSRTSTDLTEGGRLQLDAGTKVAAYAAYFRDGFYANTILGGGSSEYRIRRAGYGGKARGETDGQEVNAQVSVGYDWRKGGLSFGPDAALRYSWASLGGYRERGSLAPLEIERESESSLQIQLGGHVAYAFAMGDMMWVPQLRVAWQHETMEDSPGITARWASGAGERFRVRGPRVGRDSLLVTGGLSVQVNPHVSLFGSYTGEFLRTNSVVHQMNLGMRAEF
jgi:outer membrane autotransporter protein